MKSLHSTHMFAIDRIPVAELKTNGVSPFVTEGKLADQLRRVRGRYAE